MAKQKFEVKKCTTLIGVLDKNEEGKYFVTVEDKDFQETYELNEILDDLCGQLISLTSAD